MGSTAARGDGSVAAVGQGVTPAGFETVDFDSKTYTGQQHCTGRFGTGGTDADLSALLLVLCKNRSKF